jgi:uncharacterized protein (TIGR03118 family)
MVVWLGLGVWALLPIAARGDGFMQTNLVSDIPGRAMLTDPNLVNPWGVSFGASGPFWVSDQAAGKSTLYSVTAAGVSAVPLIVNIPQSANPPGGPTGQVAGNPDFQVGGQNAAFLFANLDGSISAWTPALGTQAKVVMPTQGAVYTGLAIGGPSGSSMLYAANNVTGKIDIFDKNYNKVMLPGTFTDPATPAGLVPFNVQNLNGKLYVTYATPGPGPDKAPVGSGSVSIYNLDGTLFQHVADGGKLASPWGVALAPDNFGEYSNALLVGNFNGQHGEINAFDPATGAYLGTLEDAAGNAIRNPDLWALTFGNGGSGGLKDTLYFTAGIDDETHGLFGAISASAAPEPNALALVLVGVALYGGLCFWRNRKRALAAA